MSRRYFVTGTGTDVGKTLISAILVDALRADYWKPVQAGFSAGTDSEWVQKMAGNGKNIHPEVYKLRLAASPHIAAREEGVTIDLQMIADRMPDAEPLIIEGAGGLMVPLNDQEFVLDLVGALKLKVILVSKNELGSINHSLLTARVCRQSGLDVAGWIFNGSYLNYEDEIVRWSGIPKIASIPYGESIGRTFIREQAALLAKTGLL